MLYLQATKKALARLGLGKEKLDAAGETSSALGNWLVNVVPIGRRDAYLFMSTRSLLSFPMLIGNYEPEVKDMTAFLEHGLSSLLKAMNTPQSQSSTLLRDLDAVLLCASTSKTLVGVHSAIAGEYHQRVLLQGGAHKADLGAVIGATNSTPRATLGWRTSLEVSDELLAASVA
jgi:hypothetical protein